MFAILEKTITTPWPCFVPFSFLNLAAKGAEPLEELCEVHISTAILIKHICKRVSWCDKLKQMVLLGKFWQHLRLSWQGGCSEALAAREAPADSTCQSCQSPTCEIWWQHCLAMMISGVDIFLWYHKPFAQAFNLIWGKGRSLNNWGPFNPWLAIAHYLAMILFSILSCTNFTLL